MGIKYRSTRKTWIVTALMVWSAAILVGLIGGNIARYFHDRSHTQENSQ